MKQKIFMIYILCTAYLHAESWSHLTINQHTFSLFEEAYDEYDSEGKTITFYRDENSTPLFSLILEDATGGCNDKSLEKGAYEINGSTIILYSLWKRQGSVDNAPYGARIKYYEVTLSGEIVLTSTQLYIEEHTEGSNPESGMKFLFSEPYTKEEREKFTQYIARVEKNFKGKFVFKEEATTLMKEVRAALRRRFKAQWSR